MYRFKVIYIIIYLCLFKSFQGYAQTDYSFEDYYLHENIIFPAATGVNYYPVSGLSYKNQWNKLNSSPRTIVVSTNFRLGKYDFYTPRMFLNHSKYFTH